ALINTMITNQDSCLAAHGGIAELMRVQEEAKRVIDSGGMMTREGIDAVFELDKNLRSRGSSPRGSAVVIACALYILALTEMKLTRSGYEE
ncbi:MAG: triphosphoribosyl-dephospho-CoA synthase, partial [Synergistaceae bacterium]|nr:triphosphoribosyl-dephospho-CoA synthase [Synergistaceae bacterium]